LRQNAKGEPSRPFSPIERSKCLPLRCDDGGALDADRGLGEEAARDRGACAERDLATAPPLRPTFVALLTVRPCAISKIQKSVALPARVTLVGTSRPELHL
jgi:hypothetical protein